MQALKDFLSGSVPASFKDARMTLESALASPALGATSAQTMAYAVAVYLGSRSLASALQAGLTPENVEQAEVAAAIMGMTNVYYSFMDSADIPGVRAMPAQLRMVSYGQQAGKDKLGFEAAALAVSVVGKCKPCIVSHVDALKQLGFTDEQFRDLARVAASVNAVAKVLH